jgi:hypothetical protein
MKLIKTEKVNTCNGWGFGGWAGKAETYDNGMVFESGKQYYRHSKPSTFKRWLFPYNDYLWDLRNDKTAKHKFAVMYHCVTPEYTSRKAALFTETEIEPFTEEYRGINLEYEIVKIIEL